jgi:hypothetical protein
MQPPAGRPGEGRPFGVPPEPLSQPLLWRYAPRWLHLQRARLDWTERAEFRLDNPAERNVMYERVIREATQVDDLRSYLNGMVYARCGEACSSLSVCGIPGKSASRT